MDTAALDALDGCKVDHQIPPRHAGHRKGENAEQDCEDKRADPGSWSRAQLCCVSICAVLAKTSQLSHLGVAIGEKHRYHDPDVGSVQRHRGHKLHK